MLVDKLHTLLKTSQAAVEAAENTAMKTILRGRSQREGGGGSGSEERNRDLRVSKFLFDISEDNAGHVDDCQDQGTKGCGAHVVSDGKV
jgi:hypothetical protein